MRENEIKLLYLNNEGGSHNGATFILHVFYCSIILSMNLSITQSELRKSYLSSSF